MTVSFGAFDDEGVVRWEVDVACVPEVTVAVAEEVEKREGQAEGREIADGVDIVESDVVIYGCFVDGVCEMKAGESREYGAIESIVGVSRTRG